MSRNMRKAVAAFFVLICLVASCMVKVSSGNAQSANSWVEKAPMPTSRASFGLAVVKGIICAIGGSQIRTVGNESFSVTTNVTEAYDPAVNSWVEKAPMPTPRCGFAAAVYDNKIYAIGGQSIANNGAGHLTNENEVYDPVTDTWETKTPIPTARESLQANVVNGKIYLIGGDPNGTLNEVYDPAADSWTTKAPLPTAAIDYASAVVDNRIYVISGAKGGGLSDIANLTQIYDPLTNRWSSAAPIPVGVSGAAAGATTGVVALKAIYVIGGRFNADPLHGHNITQVYFPATNSWKMGASMPTVRAELSVAVVNDTLYALGGGYWIFQWDSTVNEQYIPIGYGATMPSESPSTLPSPSASLVQYAALASVITAIVLVLVAVLRRRKEKSD